MNQLRLLPSVDRLLQSDAFAPLLKQHGRDPVVAAVRRDLDAGRSQGSADNGFAGRLQPVCGRVAVLAVAQRLDRGLDNVRRRLEVRLADSEIDDVPARSLQSCSARKNGEGVFLSQAVEGRNGFQVSLPDFNGRSATCWMSVRSGHDLL